IGAAALRRAHQPQLAQRGQRAAAGVAVDAVLRCQGAFGRPSLARDIDAAPDGVGNLVRDASPEAVRRIGQDEGGEVRGDGSCHESYTRDAYAGGHWKVVYTSHRIAATCFTRLTTRAPAARQAAPTGWRCWPGHLCPCWSRPW